MQENIFKIEKWCESWQLKINLEKCEILRAGSQNLNFPYAMGQELIPSKENIRDLGVYIGSDVGYKKHYSIMIRNAHYLGYLFRNSFANRNPDFLMFLYNTYILPKIEYASSVWSPFYKQDIDAVENIQRKFSKFLPGMFQKSYRERMAHLNLKTLEERRIYADMCLLF